MWDTNMNLEKVKEDVRKEKLLEKWFHKWHRYWEMALKESQKGGEQMNIGINSLV